MKGQIHHLELGVSLLDDGRPYWTAWVLRRSDENPDQAEHYIDVTPTTRRRLRRAQEKLYKRQVKASKGK